MKKGQITFTNIKIIIGFVITLVLALVLYSLMVKLGGDGGPGVPGSETLTSVFLCMTGNRAWLHRIKKQ